ncbi:14649_t:CDS:2 [Funneliformis geosporum]|nr:14649_t:CDS:2 [Funneliformis geosporum]
MSNISCFEILALNILKNSSSEKISEGVNVSELDPCSLCNQKLFFSIKTNLSYLKPDYKKKMELAVLKSPENLNDNDLMDISLLLFNDSSLLRNNFQKKHSNDPLFSEVSPNKKARKLVNRNDSLN